MKSTRISKTDKPMSNHIEEYFAESTENKEVMTSKELFRAKDEDVDIKTDLQFREITYIATLLHNDRLIKKSKLKPIYADFLNNYMRLKISLDRKSRMEFVDMNRGQNTSNEVLDTMSKVSNIAGGNGKK